MEISSFSSLIEVGVTLNIACVAVEYVKSYTSVLCNQVFNLAASINNVAKQCLQKLNEVMDETTLANLPDKLSGGRSIIPLKRSLTKSRASLVQDINQSAEKLEKDMLKVCEVKSVSSICLWLFLFGVTALFIMGIESEESERNISIHFLWTLLTVLGCIFTFVGWKSNGEHRRWWKFGYCSLRFSILAFVISLFISIVVIIFVGSSADMPDTLWRIVLILSMVLLYSNFIASSFAVWKKAKQCKQTIEETRIELLSKCEKWNGEASDLQGALHVDERLADEVVINKE